MVDIQFGSQGPVQAQPSQPVNTSAAAADNDVKTVQKNAANVVTLSAESGATRNERRRDTLGRQPDEAVNAPGRLPDEAVNAPKAPEDLRATSRRTEFDFNEELNRVFLEVIDTRTEKVIETIPPEELVRQLREQAAPRIPSDIDESA